MARTAQGKNDAKQSTAAAVSGEVSDEEAELFDRLIASAAGLPRVCTIKKCRRRKRCLGDELVCLRHHRGLARERYQGALVKLGWARPKP